MSIRIKISYQTQEELGYILRLLYPAIKSAKVKKGQQGVYKKAYIEIAGSTRNHGRSPDEA